MSEQHDAPEKKSPPPAPPKPEKAAKTVKPPRQGEGSSGAFLAALIALGALGACYYLWQQQEVARMDSKALEKSIARLLTVVEQKQQEQMESIDALASHHHEQMEQRLQNLEVALPELRNRLGQKQEEWSLAEVEYLLRIADHRLQLMEDIPSAERALAEAARQLNLLDSVRFAPVINRINQDLNYLTAMERDGVGATAAALSTLIQQGAQLPLAIIAPSRTGESETAEPDTAAGKEEGGLATLRQWGRQLWHDIKGLVTIRRNDEEPLLQPQQRYFIQESLRLKLETARLALLRREPVIYQESLAEAGSWLQRHYDPQSVEVQAAQEEIARLAEVELAVALPSLGQTLTLLQQLRARPPQELQTAPPLMPLEPTPPPLERSPLLPPPVQPDGGSAILSPASPQGEPQAVEEEAPPAAAPQREWLPPANPGEIPADTPAAADRP